LQRSVSHLLLPPFPAPCVIFFRDWISRSPAALREPRSSQWGKCRRHQITPTLPKIPIFSQPEPASSCRKLWISRSRSDVRDYRH
jgi:hypothetical protein